jgi:conjugative transfer signal peptidase TraF
MIQYRLQVTGQRIARLCLGISVFGGGVAALLVVLRMHVNTSSSLPLGLYREVVAPVTRGSIVVACLPDSVGVLAKQRGYLGRGKCPAGVVPVGKIVLAVPGDTVTFTASGMTVNGWLAPLTAPQPRDHAGRAIAPYAFGTMVVRCGTIVLYAPHARSLDARYYGPIATSNVRALIRPLWTVSTVGNGGSHDRRSERAHRRPHTGTEPRAIP